MCLDPENKISYTGGQTAHSFLTHCSEHRMPWTVNGMGESSDDMDDTSVKIVPARKHVTTQYNTA